MPHIQDVAILMFCRARGCVVFFLLVVSINLHLVSSAVLPVHAVIYVVNIFLEVVLVLTALYGLSAKR